VRNVCGSSSEICSVYHIYTNFLAISSLHNIANMMPATHTLHKSGAVCRSVVPSVDAEVEKVSGVYGMRHTAHSKHHAVHRAESA